MVSRGARLPGHVSRGVRAALRLYVRRFLIQPCPHPDALGCDRKCCQCLVAECECRPVLHINGHVGALRGRPLLESIASRVPPLSQRHCISDYVANRYPIAFHSCVVFFLRRADAVGLRDNHSILIALPVGDCLWDKDPDSVTILCSFALSLAVCQC